MSPVARTDALLSRIGRHVASIQITRFKKTTAGTVAHNIVEMFADGEGPDAPDHRVPAASILLTTFDGRVVEQCEVCPIASDVMMVLFDRCLRAAWHWRLPLAVNDERQRTESWDPRYPFGTDPSTIHVPWARDVLHRAGWAVRPEGERLTIAHEQTIAAGAIGAALNARGAAIAGIKEAGFSLSALKEKVRSAHAEAKKGQRITTMIALDPAELRWSTESRPVSDDIAAHAQVSRDEQVLATREIAALGFEAWGVLTAFGWGGYREIKLDRPRDELRAIKHLLCAHAVWGRV